MSLKTRLGAPKDVALVSLTISRLRNTTGVVNGVVLSSVYQRIFTQIRINRQDEGPIQVFISRFRRFILRSFRGLLTRKHQFKTSLILTRRALTRLAPGVHSVVLNGINIGFTFQTKERSDRALYGSLSNSPALISLGGFHANRTLV